MHLWIGHRGIEGRLSPFRFVCMGAAAAAAAPGILSIDRKITLVGTTDPDMDCRVGKASRWLRGDASADCFSGLRGSFVSIRPGPGQGARMLVYVMMIVLFGRRFNDLYTKCEL